MGGVHDHPALGPVDWGHVPLALLEEHFPDAWAALHAYDSFAVVRDPLSRAASALRQVFWQYDQRPMTLIPSGELKDLTQRTLEEVDAEMDRLAAGQLQLLPRRFIFFTPQCDFIELDGAQITRTLVPLSMVGDFLSYLARRTGAPLQANARANQNVDLRFKRIGRVAYAVNDRLRRTLPTDLHMKIRDTALKLLARRRNAAESNGLLESSDLGDFVAKHYTRDRAIVGAVSARQEALAAAFAGDALLPPILGLSAEKA